MYRPECIESQKTKLHGDVFEVQQINYDKLIIVITAIFLVFLFLLFFGTYAHVEKVSGHVVPSKGLVKIKTNNFGVLEKVFVTEGQNVEKGQRLAIVSLLRENLDGGFTVKDALNALDEQHKWLTSQIQSEVSEYQSEKENIERERQEIESNWLFTTQSLSLQKQLVNSAQSKYQRIKKASEKGIVTELKFDEYHDDLLNKQEKHNLLEQQLYLIESSKQRLAIKASLIETDKNKKTAVLNKQIAELQERRAQLNGQNKEVLSAPVSGTIVSIPNGSIGRSVSSQQPILVILPSGSDFEVEMFVPSRAIGLLEKGQEVKIFYDAFPYQMYGSYAATIDQISQSILLPSEFDSSFLIQEPAYKITSSLEKQFVEVKSGQFQLQSGMTLSANIILERRTFLQWFLSPIKGLKERT